MNKILEGDSLKILQTLEEQSVDCAITSPPYWNLRDYGVEGQLGLEPTIDDFVNNLCDIFDQVYFVLKDTGTLWVNIGDTYSGSGKGYGDKNSDPKFRYGGRDRKIKPPKTGIKDKSLCMIPERFAIEMVSRGWILRNKIIWHKPNCMPESVKDRFTTDYEFVYFFVKSNKYYFNQDAVAEPITDTTAIRILQNIELQKGSSRANGNTRPDRPMKAAVRKNFDKNMAGSGQSFKNHSGYRKDGGEYMVKPLRNKRSVWTIATRPFKEAHFATYPEKLIEPMILAGSPEGGVVLDPFIGSGTTAVVARRLGRQYIGIELNPEYIKIAEKRLAQGILLT